MSKKPYPEYLALNPIGRDLKGSNTGSIWYGTYVSLKAMYIVARGNPGDYLSWCRMMLKSNAGNNTIWCHLASQMPSYINSDIIVFSDHKNTKMAYGEKLDDVVNEVIGKSFVHNGIHDTMLECLYIRTNYITMSNTIKGINGTEWIFSKNSGLMPNDTDNVYRLVGYLYVDEQFNTNNIKTIVPTLLTE